MMRITTLVSLHIETATWDSRIYFAELTRNYLDLRMDTLLLPTVIDVIIPPYLNFNGGLARSMRKLENASIASIFNDWVSFEPF